MLYTTRILSQARLRQRMSRQRRRCDSICRCCQAAASSSSHSTCSPTPKARDWPPPFTTATPGSWEGQHLRESRNPTDKVSPKDIIFSTIFTHFLFLIFLRYHNHSSEITEREESKQHGHHETVCRLVEQLGREHRPHEEVIPLRGHYGQEEEKPRGSDDRYHRAGGSHRYLKGWYDSEILHLFHIQCITIEKFLKTFTCPIGPT